MPSPMTHQFAVLRDVQRHRPIDFKLEVKRGPERLRPRLTRAVKWLLLRLDAWPVVTERWRAKTWERIDEGNLVNALHKNIESVDSIWRGECSRVLVGPDVMCELLREIEELQQPFTVPVSFRLGKGSEVKLFGLKVQYVPWMRGTLLVPEEEK